MKSWRRYLACGLVLLAMVAGADTVGLRHTGLHPFRVDDPLRQVQFDALLWYPTDTPENDLQFGPFQLRAAKDAPPSAGHHPLVVISHGSGGNALGHRDLAAALVARGYAVLTFTHPFDNHADASALGTTQEFIDRPLELRWTLDTALAQPLLRDHLDASRIGAVGYSMGGYTVLAAAGAKPDVSRYLPYCAVQPPDTLICEAAHHGGLRQVSPSRQPVRDPRIRAMVLMAPAAVFLFDDKTLADIPIPALLYRAERDDIVREPNHAIRLAKRLPRLDGLRTIPGAGHYVFLAPCPAALAKVTPDLCHDGPGIDRAAIHDALNRDIGRFFDKTLPPAP